MGVIHFYIRLFLQSKYVKKTLWVLNNFLTMECYRKLCNRLYWKKLQPGTLPYTTRFWLIMLTAASAVCLIFFYNPADPANSASPSRIFSLLSRVFKKTGYVLSASLNLEGVKRQIKHFITYPVLESENIFLWQSRETYLRTSSIRI